MALLRKASNEMAFAKIGLLGFAGSGKTYTASELAIGLHRHIGSTKPVAFLDTETGSDFMVKRFEAAGVELLVAKSRSFADLLGFYREAQGQVDITIVDSLTHFWEDVIRAYMKKKNRTYMEFQDWREVKDTWKEFSTMFVAMPLHAIICGRAGYEYDQQENDRGRKEIVKTGIKMRAEGEFGYEPSLVIQMERVSAEEGGSNIHRKANGPARQFVNRAWVMKDRTDLLDGRHFDNPDFSTFLPHFQEINLGGTHRAIDAGAKTEDMFDANGRTDWQREKHQREKLLEEIMNKLTQTWPGQSAIEKKARLDMLEGVFGTTSETALSDMKSDVLSEGYSRLCGAVKIAQVATECGYKDVAAAFVAIERDVNDQFAAVESQKKIIAAIKASKEQK